MYRRLSAHPAQVLGYALRMAVWWQQVHQSTFATTAGPEGSSLQMVRTRCCGCRAGRTVRRGRHVESTQSNLTSQMFCTLSSMRRRAQRPWFFHLDLSEVQSYGIYCGATLRCGVQSRLVARCRHRARPGHNPPGAPNCHGPGNDVECPGGAASSFCHLAACVAASAEQHAVCKRACGRGHWF